MKHRPQQELSTIQIQMILDTLDAAHPRVGLAVHFMATLGLRLNEARQITWGWINDLDSSTPTLTIPEDKTKTRWPRTLPIPPRLHAVLTRARARQKLDPPVGPPETWPLILNRWGKPPSARYVQRTLRYASETAIGVRIRAHSLRHHFATQLLQQTNLRVVQIALGHRSIKSTEIYTHPRLEDLRQAISAAEQHRPTNKPALDAEPTTAPAD